jgi:hypothetical protein
MDMGTFLEHPATALVLSGIVWAVAMTGALGRRMAFAVFVLSDGVGVYEIQQSAGYSLAARCFFSALLTTTVGLLAWWSFSRGANVKLEATLAIEDITRTRSGGEGERWQYGHLFIQASIHLQAPKKAEVTYVLELVRHGIVTPTKQLEDVRAWHFAEGVKHGIGRKGEYRDMVPLGTSLSVMGQSDGWLHFQVKMSDIDITNSRLRLRATTRSGMVQSEKDLIGTLFDRLIVERKIA